MTREEKAGRNEALFRDVNQAIAAIEERFGSIETLTMLCECERASCNARVDIAADDYAAVRKSANRFIVRPGHEDLDVERVQQERPGYLVVEKQGTAATAAKRRS